MKINVIKRAKEVLDIEAEAVRLLEEISGRTEAYLDRCYRG